MPRKAREQREYYLKKRNNGVWYICWTESGGKPKSRSTGTKCKESAEQALADFVSVMNAPANGETVNHYLDEYLRFKKMQIAEREQKQSDYKALEYALKPIRPVFGALRVEQVTPERCRAYASKLRKEGKSNATSGKSLAILRAALKHCEKEGLLDKAPFIPLPRPPAPRDTYLTKEQIKKLLDACASHHIKLFCLLAIHTTSRKGAILELQWSQVDMDNRLVHFNPPGRAQTSKRRVAAPINKTLYSALEHARLLAQTDYVVEFEGHAPLKDIKRAFKSAVKRAELPSNVSPHTLRHTGATLLAQAGVDMYTIAGLLGDRVETVSRNYLKWSPDHLSNATNVLEGLG